MTATASQAAKPAPLRRLISGPGSTKEVPIKIPANQYVKIRGCSAGSGYYPFRLNGQWHGGIYFDESTDKRFDQRHGARCIADGEIIAWRYDKDLLDIKYEIGNYQYISGFVLVRYRLQYPKKDPPKGITLYTSFLTSYKSTGYGIVFASAETLSASGQQPRTPCTKGFRAACSKIEQKLCIRRWVIGRLDGTQQSIQLFARHL